MFSGVDQPSLSSPLRGLPVHPCTWRGFTLCSSPIPQPVATPCPSLPSPSPSLPPSLSSLHPPSVVAFFVPPCVCLALFLFLLHNVDACKWQTPSANDVTHAHARPHPPTPTHFQWRGNDNSYKIVRRQMSVALQGPMRTA